MHWRKGQKWFPYGNTLNLFIYSIANDENVIVKNVKPEEVFHFSEPDIRVTFWRP